MKGHTVRNVRGSKSFSLRDPKFLATCPDSFLTPAGVKMRNKHRRAQRNKRKHKRR